MVYGANLISPKEFYKSTSGPEYSFGNFAIITVTSAGMVYFVNYW
jgi:hypothetical protein